MPESTIPERYYSSPWWRPNVTGVFSNPRPPTIDNTPFTPYTYRPNIVQYANTTGSPTAGTGGGAYMGPGGVGGVYGTPGTAQPGSSYGGTPTGGGYNPRSAYYAPWESQYSPVFGGFNKVGSRGYGQPMVVNTFYPEWGKENYEQRWLESQSDDDLKFWQRYIEYQLNLAGRPSTTIGAGGSVDRTTPRYSTEVLERMRDAIGNRLGQGAEGLQQSPAYGAGLVTSRF